MRIYYDLGQRIVWDTFFQFNNFNTLIAVLETAGASDPDRYAGLMRAYWDERDVSQKRPGHIYFPDVLYALANKPDGFAFPPPGDFREMTAEIVVLGGQPLDFILDASPIFTPIMPGNYDPTDLYQAFSYMIGFVSGVSRFLALNGEVWSVYVGETDNPVPEYQTFKDFPYTGVGR